MKESYHLLGIGGVGMSALAHVLIEKGADVSGSDLKTYAHLKKFKMYAYIPKGKVVVYSTAIKKSHPLFCEAEKSGALLLHRSQLIDRLLAQKKGLLVGGTHGKTSTSALLSWVLYFAKKDPSYAVGGILNNFQKKWRAWKGRAFCFRS